MIRNNSVKRKLATAGLIALAAATVVGGRPAQAQQTEIEALREQLEAMQARLDSLETAKIVTDEATKATPGITATSPIRISGLMQFRGDSYRNEKGAVFPRQQDTFRIRRGEIRITAPTITSRVSGTLQIDFARGLFGNNGQAASTPGGVGIASLQEVQLSYLLKKAPPVGTPARPGATTSTPLPDNIFIDAGQFKLPFGYEGDLVSSAAIQTVERALMFRTRDVNGGGTGDVRDTGVQLRGTFGGNFDYRLAVFNGLGERQNLSASGDPKAIVARLLYRPRSLDGLQVGASYERGNTRLAPSTALPLNNINTITSLTTRFDRNAYNAFMFYKKDENTLQAEYTTGTGRSFLPFDPAGPPLPLVNEGPERKFQGYYASVGRLFTPKLEGVLRYDYFNFDRNLTTDASVKELTVGVNYYIKGNNAKIQANLVRVQGGSALVAAASSVPASGGFGGGGQGQGFQNDRTELRVQGQVSF